MTRQERQIEAATMRLYDAISAYVRAKAGDVVCIGGVEVQEWPDEGKFKFRIAVRCTGRKPVMDGGGIGGTG